MHLLRDPVNRVVMHAGRAATRAGCAPDDHRVFIDDRFSSAPDDTDRDTASSAAASSTIPTGSSVAPSAAAVVLTANATAWHPSLTLNTTASVTCAVRRQGGGCQDHLRIDHEQRNTGSPATPLTASGTAATTATTTASCSAIRVLRAATSAPLTNFPMNASFS